MTPYNVTPAQQPNTNRQAEIARRAYELYLERGCANGQDLDDWLRAERELLDEEAVGEISSVPNGPGETGDISQIAALREQVTQA